MIHARRVRIQCCALAIALAATACAEESFTVQYAPGFNHARKHISVFGVQRDGLMSRSGWAALGPGLSAPFNEQQACDVAFSEQVFNEVPALASAVDSYVRANGVTDRLLDQLAPAARGDTIMLVTIAGRARLPGRDLGGGSPMQRANPGMGRGRGGQGMGGGMMPVGREPENVGNADPFEVSALLFSIREHQTTAVVKMGYTGTSSQQALSEFKQRLEAEFPSSTCSGWNWSAAVDPKSVRELPEQ
jgi:hypothetical protein